MLRTRVFSRPPRLRSMTARWPCPSPAYSVRICPSDWPRVDAEAESKIGAQLGRRQHPAERSGAGFFRRRGLCRWAGARVVSAGLVEGDSHAGQAFQFGDELALAPE